ncbi:MAG: hypothetical protein H7A32_01545 [Deltaproteobacteria bacterium]|nr:hypothetical protein [Deltaproteobacteria bacterium]
MVKKTLDYLEKEQKKLAKQVQEASQYFKRAKDHSLRIIRQFPDKSEDLLVQFKKELSKLSNFIGLS